MATEENTPVVCTLTTKEAARQGLEWVDVQRRATTVSPIASGARLTFPASLAPQIEDLARREQGCCSFLSLTTAVEGDTLTLEITSANPDGLPVIELLAGLPLPG